MLLYHYLSPVKATNTLLHICAINKKSKILSTFSTYSSFAFLSTSVNRNSYLSDLNNRYETFLKNKVPTFYTYYKTGIGGNFLKNLIYKIKVVNGVIPI